MVAVNKTALDAGLGRVRKAIQEGGRLLYVAQDKAHDLIATVSMPPGSKRPLQAILLLQQFYLKGLGQEELQNLAAQVVSEANHEQRREARNRDAHGGQQ